MLCTSFRAPVERALRTRDIVCTSVCQGHQAVGTSQWSIWSCSDSVFSKIASESPGELIEIQIIVSHPRVYVSVSLGWAGRIYISNKFRNYEGCWFGSTLKTVLLVYLVWVTQKNWWFLKTQLTESPWDVTCLQWHHSSMWWHGFVPRHLGLLWEWELLHWGLPLTKRGGRRLWPVVFYSLLSSTRGWDRTFEI